MSALAALHLGTVRCIRCPKTFIPLGVAHFFSAFVWLGVGRLLMGEALQGGEGATPFHWLKLTLDQPDAWFRLGVFSCVLLGIHLVAGVFARSAAYGKLRLKSYSQGVLRWAKPLVLVELSLRLAHGLTALAAWATLYGWVEPYSRHWVDERWRVVAMAGVVVVSILLVVVASLWARYTEAAIVCGATTLEAATQAALLPARGHTLMAISTWALPLFATTALSLGTLGPGPRDTGLWIAAELSVVLRIAIYGVAMASQLEVLSFSGFRDEGAEADGAKLRQDS